jgi:hypothetical protein
MVVHDGMMVAMWVSNIELDGVPGDERVVQRSRKPRVHGKSKESTWEPG